MLTVDAADTDLSNLLRVVEGGEEVVIARGDRQIARLVPIDRKQRFKTGILPPGSLGDGPDWTEPMSEEDLLLWEGRSDDVGR
ncbi:MAG: type II toxin-antitoxin system prevent-host-death family antitoxin [Mesorhizobium amorphae]|nr:MAG: type II toxin-antitoxin system prevent-host-death family antitoxin [Mesorhizobium amorphae]